MPNTSNPTQLNKGYQHFQSYSAQQEMSNTSNPTQLNRPEYDPLCNTADFYNYHLLYFCFYQLFKRKRILFFIFLVSMLHKLHKCLLHNIYLFIHIKFIVIIKFEIEDVFDYNSKYFIVNVAVCGYLFQPV